MLTFTFLINKLLFVIHFLVIEDFNSIYCSDCALLALTLWVKIHSISHPFHFVHYQSFGNIDAIMWKIWWIHLFNIHFKTTVMERKDGESSDSNIMWFEWLDSWPSSIKYFLQVKFYSRNFLFFSLRGKNIYKKVKGCNL